MTRRPSFPALLLSLLAALGCQRDLEVPEPPAPSSETGPRPRFLGELSGFYAMRMWITDPESGQSFEAPIGGRFVALDVSDGEADHSYFVAFLTRGADFGLVEEPDPPGCNTIARSEANEPLLGTFTPGADLELADLEGRVAGNRGLGGGVMSLRVPTCRALGEGDEITLHAYRFCGFDPALSGVYQSPPGVEPGLDVALGFFPPAALGTQPLIVGLQWPADGQPQSLAAYLGLYDRFAPASPFVRYSPPDDKRCGNLALRQDADLLRAEVRVGDPVQDEGQCLGQGPIEGSSAVTVERQAGTRPEACAPPAAAGLRIGWAIRTCGGEPFLDVRVLFAVGSTDITLTDTSAAGLGLALGIEVDASTGPLAPVASTPPGISRRFAVPRGATHAAILAWALSIVPDADVLLHAALPECARFRE